MESLLKKHANISIAKWSVENPFVLHNLSNIDLHQQFYTYFQMFLFAAWVCIVIYFDMDISWIMTEDSEADFFKGVTIFSWVMAVLLTLTFVLSFDKLCGLSSRWTLTVSDIFLFNRY